jgi:hypothetical protein
MPTYSVVFDNCFDRSYFQKRMVRLMTIIHTFKKQNFQQLKNIKMKKQLSPVLFSFIVPIFFLLSCQKETSIQALDEEQTVSAMNNGNRENKMLPIKGTYVTTNEVLAPAPMLRQRITGVGESSHLGEGTFVAIATLNLTTPPPFQLGGTCTFYAANGDTFFTVFTGTSTPVGNGILSVVINHTITGGTGRFEDASGSFVGLTTANPANPTGLTTYEGTISY